MNRIIVDYANVFAEMSPDAGIFRQIDYWQSCLPMMYDKAKQELLATTEQICQLYPFFNFQSSSPEGGILLGFSPANEPVFFDPWSKIVTNGNVFITGMAGSGKSFLINLILNRLGPEGYDISIVDKAESYRTTCMAMNGDYLQFDQKGTYAVNVWDVLDFDPNLEPDNLNDVTPKGRVNADKIDVVLGLTEMLLAESGQRLPRLELSLLETDIRETYEDNLKIIQGKVLQDSIPTFSELAKTLDGKINSNNEYKRERQILRTKLETAIHGVLAPLVNQRTNLSSQKLCRVFDISKLPDKDETLGIAMYIITSYLFKRWRGNKAKNIRQIGVIDELYFFMLFSAGRKLLDNLARRSRHLGLNPFFATQQLNDVLKYDETRSILDNSQTKLLFSQAPNVIEKISDLLALSDTEKFLLASIKQERGVYSQCYFTYGPFRNILTIRPDPATRWLNTTEPTYDIPRLKEALAKTGNDAWAAVRLLMEQTN